MRYLPRYLPSASMTAAEIEARGVRALVLKGNVANEEHVKKLFTAIDADIRSHRVLNRRSSACPCKPRPFYD